MVKPFWDVPLLHFWFLELFLNKKIPNSDDSGVEIERFVRW